MSSENHIEEVRQRIRAVFSEQNVIPGASSEFISPNEKYEVRQQVYKQAFDELSWNVSRITVLDSKSNLIISLLIDDDSFFHHWILTNAGEYLLCAENLCGGNSVLNLENGNITSFSDGTDGFIFAGYHPSPDLTHMAILGCFWGGPYCVRVFDISNIELLPWPMILEIQLKDEEREDVIWVDNNTIRISEYPRANLTKSRDVTVNS